MGIENVTVCVDKKSLKKIDQISTELSKLGMTILDVLEISGIITGTIPRESETNEKNQLKEDLKHVQGVSSVEIDREYETK